MSESVSPETGLLLGTRNAKGNRNRDKRACNCSPDGWLAFSCVPDPL